MSNDYLNFTLVLPNSCQYVSVSYWILFRFKVFLVGNETTKVTNGRKNTQKT